jgi:hypothetical protein
MGLDDCLHDRRAEAGSARAVAAARWLRAGAAARRSSSGAELVDDDVGIGSLLLPRAFGADPLGVSTRDRDRRRQLVRRLDQMPAQLRA